MKLKLKDKDIRKAIRKGHRDAELENGWKQTQKVHKSQKNYSRKEKHKSVTFFD